MAATRELRLEIKAAAEVLIERNKRVEAERTRPQPKQMPVRPKPEAKKMPARTRPEAAEPMQVCNRKFA